MMFPNRSQIQSAVLDEMREAGSIDLQTLYTRIQRRFDMSPEEISRKDPLGGSQIQHEVRWALQTLKYNGLVKRGESVGVWQIA